MSEVFNMYPVLTKEKIDQAGITFYPVTCFYTENDEESLLNVDIPTEVTDNYAADVSDPKCVWDIASHELGIRKEIKADNLSSWFGPDGVASRNATIGLALQWISAKSDQRGIIPFAEIKIDTPVKAYIADNVFGENTLKGSLILQTIAYLKDAGTPEEDEAYLCTQTGTVLGTIDRCELFLEGNGSVFPIATINDPEKPLWTVYYDDTADPLEDSFDKDHVEIRLNKAHPCYDQLKIESSLKESPLFLEVISSALMIIITSAKESLGTEWTNVISGQNEYTHGSIAEAINYFVVKLGWDISSAAKLAQSIHSFFDANLKGGNL